jgi:hypothetical protein
VSTLSAESVVTEDPDEPARRAQRERRRRRRRIALAVVGALLVLPAISYVRALVYPGSATFSERSVEWVRDHGGSPLVDAIENAIYSRQAPPAVGPPQDVIAPDVVAGATASPSLAPPGRPVPAPVPVPALPAASALPPVRLLEGLAPLAGEGSWRRLGAGGHLEATWLRADPRHLPVIATAVLVRRGSLALHLVAGTREPVPGAVPVAATQVPRSARSRLVATFNGGFKTADARGGWQLGSRVLVPLVEGRASLVIDTHGGWRIGAWGHGVGPGPDVAAVRQNLDLLVIAGRAVPRLSSNANGRWGNSHTQLQYTSRSGLGVTASGDLVYVTGRSMTLAVLADAMARLGVVTGMEMDEHPTSVIFDVVTRQGPNGPTTSKLVSTMKPSGRRYLAPDQRDFFYLTVPAR